jgi:hypothetical protein
VPERAAAESLPRLGDRPRWMKCVLLSEADAPARRWLTDRSYSQGILVERGTQKIENKHKKKYKSTKILLDEKWEKKSWRNVSTMESGFSQVKPNFSFSCFVRSALRHKHSVSHRTEFKKY